MRIAQLQYMYTDRSSFIYANDMMKNSKTPFTLCRIVMNLK